MFLSIHIAHQKVSSTPSLSLFCFLDPLLETLHIQSMGLEAEEKSIKFGRLNLAATIFQTTFVKLHWDNMCAFVSF
jgi:hypothetical protein